VHEADAGKKRSDCKAAYYAKASGKKPAAGGHH